MYVDELQGRGLWYEMVCRGELIRWFDCNLYLVTAVNLLNVMVTSCMGDVEVKMIK